MARFYAAPLARNPTGVDTIILIVARIGVEPPSLLLISAGMKLSYAAKTTRRQKFNDPLHATSRDNISRGQYVVHNYELAKKLNE